MTSDERTALATRIANALFRTEAGDVADRLKLCQERPNDSRGELDLGGRCFVSAVNKIRDVLDDVAREKEPKR